MDNHGDNHVSSARIRPDPLSQQAQPVQPPARQQPHAPQNPSIQREAPNNGNWIGTYLGFVPSQDNIKFVDDNKILFLSSKTEVIHPEEQSYIDMLKINVYPLWKLCSLTTLFLVAQIILFIVSQGLGHESASFLEVKVPTLTDLGMNWARLVYSGQVYRLLSCLFLHINISHLLANMFLMVYLLPYYEHTFGLFRTFIALVAAGITSNIFSNIISPDSDQSMLKIGSSNFIYGIVGLGFGYIALNWSSLQIIGPIFKFKLCVTLIFSILFLIVFCDQVKVPDYAGHLGGFLAGFFFSGFMSTIEQTTEKTIARGILVSLFLIMCVGSFLFFYLLPQAAYSV